MVLSRTWWALVLTAPVMAIIAYCANHYLFDGRNDLLRRVAAIGTACGVGLLFLWVHIAVLYMARDGAVPIAGGHLWLRSHHVFRYDDTPILFWIWLVLDVFVATVGWLVAIIAGARAGFGPSPGRHDQRHRHIPSAAQPRGALPVSRGPQRPFPFNIPGACVGVSVVLSVVWVHAGLVN
jgi:hypothetical protein